MFSGLMPAMVTPFDERGEVDLEATEAVVERFVEAGVDGISPLGSTGESTHLAADERRRFTEEVVRIVARRVPLVAGVGSAGTTEAVDIPVFIYNLPLLINTDLSASLVARIAAEYPNVAGIKDTTAQYTHTVEVLQEVKPARPDFSVLAGFEPLILPSMLAGADGSICAFANVAPELFVDLVKAAREGDLQRAAELHRRVLFLLTLGAASDPPISAVKLAMRMLGVPISPAVRGPALSIPDEAHEKVESVLREAGLLTAQEVG